MNLTYLDYGGEQINPYEQNFRTMLDEADVFLGVLDGQELIKLVEGTAEHQFYINLYHILQLLQKGKQPVHFILITLFPNYAGYFRITRISRTFSPKWCSG